ncbi:isocyanide synthase family protein [Legionella worsleiensis]|uniref:Pyoverdine biosynthesis protein PvcA n=1 Tax=Legionella worsleiensis TaxID=45076 RepID=A0A0W1AAD9_9GAMM|nr:isocyanide synthase family protein [Legionella worsleiensis]KTD78247.1 pyoverdine biosynthesis protein PvcA [Legionella worsleiensis]STY32584.1 pyoverdine biosynthesis protein PvcA [Legionella worsleiensis]
MKQAILNIILEKRGNALYHQCQEQLCMQCAEKISAPIDFALAHNQAIHFVLPAFPAKSANREKTLSHLPDIGEQLALININDLLEQIAAVYAPGARLTICSDGRVFNDIVGVSDHEVTAYVGALHALVNELKLSRIDFFDLSDCWPNMSFTEMREHLVQFYASSIEEIKSSVKNNDNEKKLFNGLHRFLVEDYAYLIKNNSKNQIRKRAHQHTYQLIQRSHAWGELIKSKYPNSIRLSIHPQTCASNKLAYQLVESSHRWATPWHNVVVVQHDRVTLMKNSEAKRIPTQLIWQNGRPSHYQLLEDAS